MADFFGRCDSEYAPPALIAALLCIGILLSACTPAVTPTPAAIANPASVYCTEHGGKPVIVTAADGSQTGNCTFPDNTQCEEWAFSRGECVSGNQAGKLAVQKLAADLKVDTATIQVNSTEPVTWPDTCLGLAGTGEVCAQAETAGYRIILAAGDKQYTLRTTANGSLIRTETK